MAHTPGPWIANTNDCRDVAGMVMLPVTNGEYPITFVPVRPADQPEYWCACCIPESLANARLIAAAPDLLAALEGCHDAINELASGVDYDGDELGEWLVQQTGNPSWGSLFNEILAAISKALA